MTVTCCTTSSPTQRRLLIGDCSLATALRQLFFYAVHFRRPRGVKRRRATDAGRHQDVVRMHGTGHDRCQGAGMYSGPGASFAAGFRAVVAWPKYFLLLEVRVASRSSGVGNLRIVHDC